VVVILVITVVMMPTDAGRVCVTEDDPNRAIHLGQHEPGRHQGAQAEHQEQDARSPMQRSSQRISGFYEHPAHSLPRWFEPRKQVDHVVGGTSANM